MLEHEAVVIENEDDTSQEPTIGNFEMTQAGLLHYGKYGPEHVSGRFDVISRARNPQGEVWSRWLRWTDEDGREHTFAITDTALHNDSQRVIGEIAGGGLWIGVKQGGKLLKYINLVSKTERWTVVDRTGWHELDIGTVFVLPDETIGPNEDERVVLDPTLNSSVIPYDSAGSLDDWKNGVGSLVGDHGRAIFGVSVAFAGPFSQLPILKVAV
jgi:putative DNA primase/helicase